MLVGQEQIAMQSSPMGHATSLILCWPMLLSHSTATGRGPKGQGGPVILEGLQCWSPKIQVSFESVKNT